MHANAQTDDSLITETEDIDSDTSTGQHVHTRHVYQTKHAQWLAYVLGDSNAVFEYDSLRREARHGSSEQLARLRVVMARMKTALLEELQRLQSAAAYGKATASTERRRKVSEQLLNSWA